MAVKPPTAPRTGCLPASGRHSDFVSVTPVGPGPDLATLRPPYPIVTVSSANQGVRDLVQDRVPHLVVGVPFDEVGGEFDPSGRPSVGGEADPRPTDIRVEPELPPTQPMRCHQLPGQFTHPGRPFGQTEPTSTRCHGSPLPTRGGQRLQLDPSPSDRCRPRQNRPAGAWRADPLPHLRNHLVQRSSTIPQPSELLRRDLVHPHLHPRLPVADPAPVGMHPPGLPSPRLSLPDRVRMLIPRITVRAGFGVWWRDLLRAGGRCPVGRRSGCAGWGNKMCRGHTPRG